MLAGDALHTQARLDELIGVHNCVSYTLSSVLHSNCQGAVSDVHMSQTDVCELSTGVGPGGPSLASNVSEAACPPGLLFMTQDG